MAHSEQSSAGQADFRRALTGAIPQLHAYARGLCGRPDMAEDLVQEAMLKAWTARDKFEPGTSLRAWTFTILRNAYFSDMRRNRFRGDYNEDAAEQALIAPAEQEEQLHLSDMHRAIMTLPAKRRQALLLVGAGGYSYGEAAQISDCAVGTIKSRVGRARAALDEMLNGDGVPQRPSKTGSAHKAILKELQKACAKTSALEQI